MQPVEDFQPIGYNDPMDEINLAQAAKNGDLNAFNRLILEYQELAYNVAYRILGDPAAADDATQDAFISAYNNLRSYRGGSFRAWLMRMVTNKCYDELRWQKRHDTTPIDPIHEETDEEIESAFWMADDSPSPEENAETSDLESAVQKCIQLLPEEFRVIVIMIDIQDFGYSEVSEVIGKPLGTIKSRLARARLRLRDCLQRFRELLPDFGRLESRERL